jgi:serine phosphatase RsbU (regulator of sigma subunit)
MGLLELDPEYIDFYIMQNGICINMTSPSDSGLNFYSSGEGRNDFLLQIQEQGRSVVQQWSMENDTKRFKCYGFQATEDKKYVVVAGCYSETADELTDMFRQRMNRIVRENNKILSVNLYLCSGNVPHGLSDDTLKPANQDNLILQAVKDKSHIAKSFSKYDRTFMADYFYHDFGKIYRYNNGSFAFSVISDITESNAMLYNIIKRQVIIILSFLVLLSLILLLATRKLKITLKDLLKKTSLIADGALHERVIVTGKNEFTDLAEQFNLMVEKLEASQNELKKKNKDITDSIQYARRIQSAILPHEEVIKYLLPKHFIFYKPRNIVSGDFYWLTHKRGEIIIVVADCTGHGVPGAFMSMLGSTLLNDVLNSIETLKSNLILNELRDQVILRLRQTGQESETKDGMDISLCLLNKDNMKLQFAGAYNPLYMIRNGKLTEIKADKMPIGISPKAGKPFTNHEIKVRKDDTFYLFSDGIIDQFGGDQGKKYLSTRFQQLLLRIQDKIMFDQKQILEHELNDWMGMTGMYPHKYEQIDDIIVMGIRI